MSVSTWAIHHSEKYFEHPDDFMPERWLDPDSKDTKQANRAFSVGARSCIGREYDLYRHLVSIIRDHWLTMLFVPEWR